MFNIIASNLSELHLTEKTVEARSGNCPMNYNV